MHAPIHPGVAAVAVRADARLEQCVVERGGEDPAVACPPAADLDAAERPLPCPPRARAQRGEAAPARLGQVAARPGHAHERDPHPRHDRAAASAERHVGAGPGWRRDGARSLSQHLVAPGAVGLEGAVEASAEIEAVMGGGGAEAPALDHARDLAAGRVDGHSNGGVAVDAAAGVDQQAAAGAARVGEAPDPRARRRRQLAADAAGRHAVAARRGPLAAVVDPREELRPDPVTRHRRRVQRRGRGQQRDVPVEQAARAAEVGQREAAQPRAVVAVGGQRAGARERVGAERHEPERQRGSGEGVAGAPSGTEVRRARERAHERVYLADELARTGGRRRRQKQQRCDDQAPAPQLRMLPLPRERSAAVSTS
jgi:hypothetical protein